MRRYRSGSSAPGWARHPGADLVARCGAVSEKPARLYCARIDDDAPTILDRLTRAGISDDRAQRHLASGAVLVDGERVTDPAPPAGPSSRILLLPA
jgi:hypothetical protein